MSCLHLVSRRNMRSVRRERVSGLFFGTPAVTLNASKADIVRSIDAMYLYTCNISVYVCIYIYMHVYRCTFARETERVFFLVLFSH